MISSMYIHIPFCKTICSYCDFCKMYYQEEWISSYLDTIEQEIESKYSREELSTIYIGGGTPNSLDGASFERLLKMISKLPKSIDYEYTVECNVELLNEKQIILMKKYGVNRISLGVQTIQEEYLKLLNRHHTKEEVIYKIKLLKENGFSNINIDLMYAFPGESLDDLKEDLSFFLSLDVPHISTYSLMIEPHTVLYTKGIEPIDEELDASMYQLIIDTLSSFEHYEVSNFAKRGYESKHNLVYWNNNEYYGFGLGASGYIRGIRYTNTCNLTKYLSGLYVDEEHILSIEEKMENEMILGLRKLKGVSMSNFYHKYGLQIMDVFKIDDLLNSKRLKLLGDYIKINKEYIYTSNDILVHFIGSDNSE